MREAAAEAAAMVKAEGRGGADKTAWETAGALQAPAVGARAEERVERAEGIGHSQRTP